MTNVGILGCVAPSILNPRSYCQWSPFPALMGKMSSLRKTSRMIRELKEVTGNKINASQNAALIEYTPLIFEMIIQKLETGNKEDVYDAVQIMDDLNISMDLFKENFIELLTGDNEKRFNAIPTAIKGAFTRAYNHTHQSSIKPVKKSKKAPGDPSSLKNFDPLLQDKVSSDSWVEDSEEDGVDMVGKGGKPATPKKAKAKPRGGSAPQKNKPK